MRTLKAQVLLLLLLALGMLPVAIAQTMTGKAVPYPRASTPAAQDLGELNAQSSSAPMSITVALSLRDASGAEKLVQALHTPGNPQFHKFLTADEFAARFAPSEEDVAKVTAAFARYGLVSERTTATTLRVTGLPADIERAFSVSLHHYSVAAHGNSAGYTFHAPLSRATVPAGAFQLVSAVAGLDTRPSFRPRSVQGAPLHSSPRTSSQSGSSGNPPQFLTVTDFANQYDVQPLYKKGVSGSGRTIGVMSLANFTPSDAFAYWNALGLAVNPNRLQIVNVDGGPGAPSDDSGSLETTLDVEQSGGIAPGANMIIYLAPNTTQAFVDVFAAAIEANKADTLSISWGQWEWFDNLDNSPATDPLTGHTVATTQAVHELLLRAAIQGESVFAASGDSGAYDVNGDLGCFPSTSPSCANTLSVDYPASDPAITAAGGTTLPATLEFCLNAACSPPYFPVNIQHEQVWGWDYLLGLCSTLGFDPVSCGIFPAGSGGGVSVFFPVPVYQLAISGVQRSQPNQAFVYDGQLFFKLPSNYPGRNVPDVSFNADPETGYIVFYTSSANGFGEEPGWGGTSFVAPQLNGVSALNYPMYLLALTGKAYKGPAAPLHAISFGDNWFYHGSNGYNPAVGLGTLDVANFAAILKNPF
jgi:kumamolisin